MTSTRWSPSIRTSPVRRSTSSRSWKKSKVDKQVAIRLDSTGDVYVGSDARVKLGLPDNGMTTKAKPGDHKDYTIFVQSTAHNRKLIGGTECLILR